MRWSFGFLWAAALIAIVSGQAVTTSYHDAETGFTFSQHLAEYTLSQSITFRIAVPSPVQANTPYDAVIQVVAPVDVGWTGLAWGSSMIYDPLTVFWANGNNVVLSSRYTSSHVMPLPFAGASYEVFRVGTHVNGTAWQYTAKCTGCTTFLGNGNRTEYLSPVGTNNFAFAYASSRPSSPSSNTSSFSVHDVTAYWGHDFSLGTNTNFDSLVTKNL